MQPIATSNFWLLRAKTTPMTFCFGSLKFLWRLSNSQCCQNLVSVLIICVHYWWGRKHSSQLGTFLGHLSSFFYCYWHTVYAAISLRCKQLLIPYFSLALAAYYYTGYGLGERMIPTWNVKLFLTFQLNVLVIIRTNWLMTTRAFSQYIGKSFWFRVGFREPAVHRYRTQLWEDTESVQNTTNVGECPIPRLLPGMGLELESEASIYCIAKVIQVNF